MVCRGCAGLCCTVFVPETKRVDLDEAALHSKSLFGHFLDRWHSPGQRQLSATSAIQFSCVDQHLCLRCITHHVYLLVVSSQYGKLVCTAGAF